MRPDRVVLVCGTGTEVGKTWVAARLLAKLRTGGLTVAARKPAQSFDIDGRGDVLGGATDAEVLGVASGEHPDVICRPSRSYHRAMAPPIAAAALGLASFTVADLVGELQWPDAGADVGLVEMAGGVRSPQADDGDVCDFVHLLRPDLVILVADAGLGTINSIRLCMDALAGSTVESEDVSTVVVLNRYDGDHEIHRRNRDWLAERCLYSIVTLPGEERLLADLVAGS